MCGCDYALNDTKAGPVGERSALPSSGVTSESFLERTRHTMKEIGGPEVLKLTG